MKTTEESLVEYWIPSPPEICHLVRSFVGFQLWKEEAVETRGVIGDRLGIRVARGHLDHLWNPITNENAKTDHDLGYTSEYKDHYISVNCIPTGVEPHLYFYVQDLNLNVTICMEWNLPIHQRFSLHTQARVMNNRAVIRLGYDPPMYYQVDFGIRTAEPIDASMYDCYCKDGKLFDRNNVLLEIKDSGVEDYNDNIIVLRNAEGRITVVDRFQPTMDVLNIDQCERAFVFKNRVVVSSRSHTWIFQ